MEWTPGMYGEECRQHARALAAAAGLIIENDMPPQCPTTGVVDKKDAIATWIAASRPQGLVGPLTADQTQWFLRRWLEDSKPLWNGSGRLYHWDIAAVQVVFARAPIFEPRLSRMTTPLTIRQARRKKELKETKEAKKEAKKDKELVASDRARIA